MHHSRAQLSWQTQMCKIQSAISLAQQPSLTLPFLRGNSVKTNTHARLKTKGRRQRHVGAQNFARALGLSSDLAIMSCVPSPFKRHAAFSKACSLFHSKPMVLGTTWVWGISKVTRKQRGTRISPPCCGIFTTQEPRQILPILTCALESMEGILFGTLPPVSVVSSASPNESAGFYLCSASLDF